MAWLINVKELRIETERGGDFTHIYQVGYLEEKETFINGLGKTTKFVFNPIYNFKTIEEAEEKTHYLNGGNTKLNQIKNTTE